MNVSLIDTISVIMEIKLKTKNHEIEDSLFHNWKKQLQTQKYQNRISDRKEHFKFTL